MATRYEVQWTMDGRPRSRAFAFRDSALDWFGVLCNQEAKGDQVNGARVVFLGPNGERFFPGCNDKGRIGIGACAASSRVGCEKS